MIDNKRLMIFRMLSEYAEMQGLDLRDIHNTSIADDIWRFGFYFENEKLNPHFVFHWEYLTVSSFEAVYKVIHVFEDNTSIINSLPHKHNFNIQKEKTSMMNYSLLELLKEEQSVILHIEQMKQEEKEVNTDMMHFNCGIADEDHVPTVETRKLLTTLERRQRIVIAELQALDQELAMVRGKIKEYIQCTLGLQTM